MALLPVCGFQATVHTYKPLTIFEFEVKLHETDLRQLLTVKRGGGFSDSSSQDKLIPGLSGVSAIHTSAMCLKKREYVDLTCCVNPPDRRSLIIH